MRPALEKALAEARTIPPAELPRLLGDLEEIRAVALMRLTPGAESQENDELLDVNEAAKRLHVSPHYVYRNAKRFPFARRIGRKLLFSSAGLNAYLRRAR